MDTNEESVYTMDDINKCPKCFSNSLQYIWKIWEGNYSGDEFFYRIICKKCGTIYYPSKLYLRHYNRDKTNKE
jgi:uncharacterized OB-fold protein